MFYSTLMLHIGFSSSDFLWSSCGK